MACAACAANVEKKLKSLEGVADAVVSLPARTAFVEWNEEVIQPADMKSALNGIGFDLIIEEGADVEEMERRSFSLLTKKAITSWGIAILVMAITMGWIHLGNRQTTNQTAMILAIANMLYCGREFYVKAWKQCRHLTAGMDTLVALSTSISLIFSIFNTFWGDSVWGARGLTWHTYFDASVMIITFILTGKVIEQRARKSTSDAIRHLMGMTPKTARLYKGEVTGKDGKQEPIFEEVPISTIQPGDIIEVRAGDKIPVDGQVRWANSFMIDDGAYVDESMTTGEPAPVLKKWGNEVLAGTVLSQGRLRMKAIKTGEKTALAAIIRMVEEAQGSKAPVQRTVDKIAMIFVPVVVAAALLTFFLWWIIGGNDALPQAIMSAVAVLIISCPCALGLATPTALMVGIGNAAKRHILIKDAAALENIRNIDAILIDKTGTLTIPNRQIDFTKSDQLPIVERESLKPHAREAIATLQQMGVQVCMMSGDREDAVAHWAQEAGITDYRSRVLPGDKEKKVREWQLQGKCVAMVGDGINDSQALATADVSIAMGKGTDVAIDVAQMTLMGDDLRRIPEALSLSKQTVNMVRQNLFWAFIYNIVCIPLAAGVLHLAGIDWQITPTWASALMACSSISVVLNSLRLRLPDQEDQGKTRKDQENKEKTRRNQDGSDLKKANKDDFTPSRHKKSII